MEEAAVSLLAEVEFRKPVQASPVWKYTPDRLRIRVQQCLDQAPDLRTWMV